MGELVNEVRIPQSTHSGAGQASCSKGAVIFAGEEAPDSLLAAPRPCFTPSEILKRFHDLTAPFRLTCASKGVMLQCILAVSKPEC